MIKSHLAHSYTIQLVVGAFTHAGLTSLLFFCQSSNIFFHLSHLLIHCMALFPHFSASAAMFIQLHLDSTLSGFMYIWISWLCMSFCCICTHLDSAVKMNAQLHCTDSPHISFPFYAHCTRPSVYYSRIRSAARDEERERENEKNTRISSTHTHIHTYRIGIFFKNCQNTMHIFVVSTTTTLIAYVSYISLLMHVYSSFFFSALSSRFSTFSVFPNNFLNYFTV